MWHKASCLVCHLVYAAIIWYSSHVWITKLYSEHFRNACTLDLTYNCLLGLRSKVGLTLTFLYWWDIGRTVHWPWSLRWKQISLMGIEQVPCLPQSIFAFRCAATFPGVFFRDTHCLPLDTAGRDMCHPNLKGCVWLPGGRGLPGGLSACADDRWEGT